MISHYAAACFFAQPCIDDPELFLAYKLFDFAGPFYTAYGYPALTFVSTGEGVIALAACALIPTIEEAPPRLGFPFRTPAHPVRGINWAQCTFRHCCSTRPSAIPRLQQVFRRTRIAGTICSPRKPSLPSNLYFN